MTMGKNNRKNKSKGKDASEIANAFTSVARQFNKKHIQESFEMMAEMDKHPLSKQKEIIRNSLVSMGTDCEKNDNDPTGNGDQSMIQFSDGRQAARDLYSIGGDIHQHAADRAISTFGTLCMMGNVKHIQSMINDVKKRVKEKQSEPWYCTPNNQQEMVSLLETRETSMRLSPLLLIVSLGKNPRYQKPGMDLIGTAKFLLECGADPYAQDVLGKTVAHYGSGATATPMTLAVVDMCVQAAESAHLFGKKVELFGLKAKHMNGLQGIVGGHSYEPEESGRRIVYLMDDLREIKVRPCNIRLAEEENESGKPKMLLDVQDRMGSVSLHEVVLVDREDLAEFLLVKHNTSIYTKDMDGISPLQLCTNGMQMTAKNVSKIVNAAARREGSRSRSAKKHATEDICANCNTGLSYTRKVCSACKLVSYCGRECQVAHWKSGHKAECKKLRANMEGIKLSPPSSQLHSASISYIPKNMCDEGSYRNPDGVRVGDKFVVKVQGGIPHMPIMVYDETRTCNFSIDPGKPGFEEVSMEVKKDMTWNGRKTFMKASFDKKGDCTIYPATAGVRIKYDW